MNQAPILKILQWPDEAACQAWAVQLAPKLLHQNILLSLHGPLGCGKTTFTRHLLHALGVQGPIKSPSYTVIETYTLASDPMPWPISHCDFYRFKDPQEWEDAGLRDVFAHDGLKLCEWPDKAMGFLPLADLALEWQVNLDESRTVQLLAHTPAGEDVLP